MTPIKFNIDTSDLVALLPLAAKSDVRKYIEGIYVEATGCVVTLVATDGTVLGALRIDGGDEAEGSGEFTIPRSMLEAVKPIRGIAQCTVTYDPVTTDIKIDQHCAQQTAKALEGKFPDWRRVIPTKCSGEVSQFRPDQIAQLAKVSKNLSTGTRYAFPALHINHSGDSSALVRIPSQDRFIGVLQPVRTDGVKATVPAWVTAAQEGAQEARKASHLKAA